MNSAKRDFQEPNAIAVVWATGGALFFQFLLNQHFSYEKHTIKRLSSYSFSPWTVPTCLTPLHSHPRPTQRPPLLRPFLVLNSRLSFCHLLGMLCKGSPLLLIPTYDPASWNEHFSPLRMRVRYHFGEQVKKYKPYDHIIKDLASLSFFMAMPLYLSPQPSTSCSLGSTPVLMIESIEHKIYHFGHFTVHSSQAFCAEVYDHSGWFQTFSSQRNEQFYTRLPVSGLYNFIHSSRMSTEARLRQTAAWVYVCVYAFMVRGTTDLV